ncbi:MAG: hypothetical protein AB8G95_00980 [Anaerolineae bacterium]
MSTRPPDVVARTLQVYGIRYLIIHHDQDKKSPVWSYVRSHPNYFSPIDYFIPPADQVEIGFNEIRIELRYAKSPAELGIGNDPRAWGVGFRRLEIRSIE